MLFHNGTPVAYFIIDLPVALIEVRSIKVRQRLAAPRPASATKSNDVDIDAFAGHIAIALYGTAFWNFVSGLILLGIGWNFLFIGGTTLVASAYQPAERAKTQAAHDFLMFGLASAASFSAGTLMHWLGWQAVNLTALPFLVLAWAAMAWLKFNKPAV